MCNPVSFCTRTTNRGHQFIIHKTAPLQNNSHTDILSSHKIFGIDEDPWTKWEFQYQEGIHPTEWPLVLDRDPRNRRLLNPERAFAKRTALLLARKYLAHLKKQERIAAESALRHARKLARKSGKPRPHITEGAYLRTRKNGPYFMRLRTAEDCRNPVEVWSPEYIHPRLHLAYARALKKRHIDHMDNISLKQARGILEELCFKKSFIDYFLRKAPKA